MIYLNSGTNSVTTTLFEKSTSANPFYTWQLTRKGTFEDVIFYQQDSSPIPYYYNTFTISITTGTVGLTQGIIKANSGEWTYIVYEMPTAYNLNIASASGIVETGICIINGTYTPNKEYTGTDDANIIYYKNM